MKYFGKLVPSSLKYVSLTLMFSLAMAVSVSAEQERGTAIVPVINIRAGNSTSADIIGTASEGDTFFILARVGDWYRVSFNFQVAYIFSEFLETNTYVSEESSIQTPVQASFHIPSATVPPAHTAAVPASSDEAAPSDFAALLASWHSTQEAVETTPEEPAAEEPSPEETFEIEVPSFGSAPQMNETSTVPDFSGFNISLVNLVVTDLGADSGVHAVVNSETGLNLRRTSSTDADVVTVLYPWQTLNVYEILGEWVRVSTMDGLSSGYVSYEFVTIRTGSRSTPPAHNAPKALEIINFARQFIGTPYAFGGTDLVGGVDCSGFVFSVMGEFDIHLGRSSRDMINNGIPIDREDIAPGDLLFFSANGTVVTHVALYIGSGQFIHSTDARRLGVSFSSLNSEHSQRTYFGARRVIPAE